MLPRLRLTVQERRAAISLLFDYLDDRSRIVKIFSMQALADFAAEDAALRGQLLPVFEMIACEGSPAMKARARKLIRRIKK